MFDDACLVLFCFREMPYEICESEYHPLLFHNHLYDLAVMQNLDVVFMYAAVWIAIYSIHPLKCNVQIFEIGS